MDPESRVHRRRYCADVILQKAMDDAIHVDCIACTPGRRPIQSGFPKIGDSMMGLLQELGLPGLPMFEPSTPTSTVSIPGIHHVLRDILFSRRSPASLQVGSVSDVSRRVVCDVSLSMQDVWRGAEHTVSLSCDSVERTYTVRTPAGTADGSETAVAGTPLTLRFNRATGSMMRKDGPGRYSVCLNGDDVVYTVSVSGREARLGFTRTLGVTEITTFIQGDRVRERHLHIRCAPGRTSPMRFSGKGVAGRGSAVVLFDLPENIWSSSRAPHGGRIIRNT